jgi:hypothetical protein
MEHNTSHTNSFPRPVCLDVDFIYPPIPDRSFDWGVYEADHEEGGYQGYGPTREAAIASFFEWYDESKGIAQCGTCGQFTTDWETADDQYQEIVCGNCRKGGAA